MQMDDLFDRHLEDREVCTAAVVWYSAAFVLFAVVGE